jgi:hypothetical protein
MIRFTAFITCSAVFALAVPAGISAAAPVMPPLPAPPVSSAVSALAAAGAKVSASPSETSFEASRVGSVRVRYSFSKRSTLFKYRLTFKNGTNWQTVNKVKKTGSFKGSHRVALKKFLAGQSVEVGSYRLKLTADGGTKTLGFTVTSEPPEVVKPQAGPWHSTSLTGPYRHVGGTGFSDSMELTQLFFEVAPDATNVSKFGFSYNYWGPAFPSGEPCAGSANGVESVPSPITNGQFSNPDIPNGAEFFRFQGTFDSPTTAHGTAQFGTTITDARCRLGAFPVATGTFTWTATR